MKTNPLFTLFVIGYPDAPYEYFPEAAKQFDVNLKVKYHGCIIRTIYKNDFGIKITDASVEELIIEEDNIEAVKYYENIIGKDWLEKIRQKANLLYEKNSNSNFYF
jgi:hypothetical protein